jgi:hypothetical protein
LEAGVCEEAFLGAVGIGCSGAADCHAEALDTTLTMPLEDGCAGEGSDLRLGRQ